MPCQGVVVWVPGPRVDDAGWAEWLIAHEGSECALFTEHGTVMAVLPDPGSSNCDPMANIWIYEAAEIDGVCIRIF